MRAIRVKRDNLDEIKRNTDRKMYRKICRYMRVTTELEVPLYFVASYGGEVSGIEFQQRMMTKGFMYEFYLVGPDKPETPWITIWPKAKRPPALGE